MNKILKRLFTGVLTLATVFTALPTTAVHAAETQYWTESEERVGIVERVENNGSISETFNEGHMTVEGEDAYCIDINTGFKNGYKTRSDASTRMSAEQIEDVALSLEYVKQYTKNHSGISSQHAYLLRQLVVWQRLSVHLGWSCDNVRASYDEISKSVQDEVFAGAKAFVRENKGRYDCYGYIYTGEGQDLGQFFAELAVGNGKIQKFSSNATVTNGNDCYSLSGATYGVYSDKGCTKSVATLATNANGNTDIKNMETLGDQFIEEMRVLSESGGGKKIKQFKQELELAEKRIAEIDSIIMKLFEQNVAGKISDGRFEKMSVTYENEQRELEERRKALKEKIEAEDYKTKNTNQFLETIRKYENVTELNRSMLVELIDSIYVYQAEGTGKERTQKVEINYRFLCESQCGIA